MPPGLAGRKTAPTSMMSPKVYRPTMEEFSDFMGFIKKIELEDNAQEAGFCKVIPPKEWIPRRSGYDLNDLNFTIEGPIKQKFQNVGEPGCYQTKGIIQPKMTVVEYNKMVHTSKYAPPANSGYDDLEKKYWKSVGYCSPIYGADVSNTISDPDLTIWNIAKLDSILKYVSDDLDMSIQGVNTPYLYFGMWKATFSWHVEDMDLYAINMVHSGAPKTWYCVPPKYGHKLERACRELFPNIAANCSNFMRHKTCLLAPRILDKYGVPYQKMHQEEREIIVVFPYAYHSGFNHGFNIAESTNFATERWIEYGKRARPCDCERSRVKFSMEKFIQRYQPEKYELWKEGLDIEPHPEDPPDVRAEIIKRAQNPKEFARQIEEKNRNKLKKIKEKDKNSAASSDKEVIYEAQVYQLVVNRRIEIEVEHEPFKVLSSLVLLEKYLQRKELDIEKMIDSGELVWAGTRPIQISKKRKPEEDDEGNKDDKQVVEEDKFIVEKKTVALYKHANSQNKIHVSVDPLTKELTSEPSTKLMAFLKEIDFANSVKQLIECGVFIKVCDCIMEVKKIKVAKPNPVPTKKIKIEPSSSDENPIVKPEQTALPAVATPMIKHLDIYRHKDTGHHFTISKSLKVIGRLHAEKKAIFEGTTVQNLIDEGQLRRIGSRKVKDRIKAPNMSQTAAATTISRGIFKLPYDEKETRIELVAKDHRHIYSLPSVNQEIFNILCEADTKELSQTLTMIGSSQDCQTPLNVIEAMLNPSLQYKQSVKDKEEGQSGFLHGTENVIALLKKNSTPDKIKYGYDHARNFITWTDTLGGRLYLIRDGGLPKELFEMPKKEKVMPEVKKETIKGTDFDSHNDDDDDDDDDDDELMYTSDESSESNDESGDETYCGSGSAKQWKSTSLRSLQRKKRRREREERRLDRLARRANGEGRRARNFAAEEAPTYTKITKELLSKDKELKEMNGTFTTESLATKFEISKSKTTNIIRIFNGLKIVKEVNEEEHEYVWLGHSFDKLKEVLMEILREPDDKIKTKDVLWNICVEILRSLLTSPKGQRRFLPIIHNETYIIGEKRRFLVAGVVIEALGLAKKQADNLGGLVYNGPNVYPDYCQQLKEDYEDKDGDLKLKEVKLVLRPVKVKEEHVYEIRPPQYKSNSQHVSRLDPEEEKDRSIKNKNIVCQCGFTKKITPVKVIREGHKSHVRNKVVQGQKRRTRCKLCDNCLRDPCRKCDNCLKPHLKKPCRLRECQFPIVPKCPCFD